jgi:uncharacterized protein (DUF1499 family)
MPRRSGVRAAARLALAASGLALAACAGSPPPSPTAADGPLPPCPPSPNCVSSDATDAAHHVDAFALDVPAADAWDVTRRVVAALPRTGIAAETGRYLRAECRSAVFGFVDDLELELRPDDHLIAVRSASRVGYSDLGVNRRRVERLRAALVSRGVVKATQQPTAP